MSAGAIPLVTARRRSALARALGPAIAEALDAPDVVEALINADGRLWLDRIGEGLVATQHALSPQDREAAIRLLAHEAGEIVGEAHPSLQTILPDSAARGSVRLVSSCTAFGLPHCSSAVSSRMTTREFRNGASARSAFNKVVLPEPVPPATMMLRLAATAAASISA